MNTNEPKNWTEKFSVGDFVTSKDAHLKGIKGEIIKINDDETVNVYWLVGMGSLSLKNDISQLCRYIEEAG